MCYCFITSLVNICLLSEIFCCNWFHKSEGRSTAYLTLRNLMTEEFELHLSSCIMDSNVSSIHLRAVRRHIILIIFLLCDLY